MGEKYKIGDIRNGFPVLPTDRRKKILLLSDDLRLFSGIATVSKNIVNGIIHQYSVVQLGAAIKHPDNNKIFNMNEATTKLTKVPDAQVSIYASQGYGNQNVLRHILHRERPDAILHFTDPRQWWWLYNMEHEIRQHIPIFYYNIWDCPPAPLYNRDFYRSCDLIMNISKQTHALVKKVLENNNEIDLNNDNVKFKDDTIYTAYVPHGIDKEQFFKMHKDHEKIEVAKREIFGDKEFDFVVFWNNRNIRRKMPIDVMLAFKQFVNELPKAKKDKVALIMHTTPRDKNGTDLYAIKDDLLHDVDNVFLHSKKVSVDQLNILYNIVDVTINIASNEGWGLSSTESLMAETMIINNTTGGLQDQCRFEDEKEEWFNPTPNYPSNHYGEYKKHGVWCEPVFPSSISCVGSIPTPYIYDERCSIEDVSKAMRKIYILTPEERDRRGKEGRKWVCSEEAKMSSQQMSESFMKYMNKMLDIWKPKKRFNIYNSNDIVKQVKI